MIEQISIDSFYMFSGDLPMPVSIFHLFCDNTKSKYTWAQGFKIK